MTTEAPKVDDTKQLKLKRRSAKANVTRKGKVVEQLLEEKCSKQEVTEAFTQMKIAFEGLQEKHESYVMTIEDDTEFEEEEVWLDGIQSRFLTIKFKVKDYEKEDDVSVDEKPDGDPDDSNKVAKCNFKMEKPKLPTFSGDVREYSIFKADFRHLVSEKYNKRDAITILRSCLKGKPLAMIQGIGSDYDAAMEYLDSVYGDPRYIADAIVNDINKFKALQDGEDGRFCDFVHLVRRSFNCLKEVIAQIALKQTAEEGETKYPKAAFVLKENVYMDDICTSVKTVEEASRLTKEIDVLLSNGGFKVKEWWSNKHLDNNVDYTQDGKLLEAQVEGKVLGVLWNPKTDCFTYRVKLSEKVISTNRKKMLC